MTEPLSSLSSAAINKRLNPVSKFLIKTFTDSAISAAENLTTKVREQAVQLGWPVEIASQLIVDFQEGKYVVTYPNAVGHMVVDLEYGNQRRPPLPAIRQFLSNIDDTGIRAEVEKRLKKERVHF